MKINRVINTIFSSNSFIIEDNGEAILIDIGDWTPIHEFLSQNNLSLKALFITHTHYDHIYGIRQLIDTFPDIPIYTSHFGKEALAKSKWNFSRYHDDIIEISSPHIIPLSDNQKISPTHNLTVKTLETPGHDKSSLSFIVGNNLFSGDSFIPDVKVVASFPNSNRSQAEFWYEKLKVLSTTHNIYPGHNPPLLL